MYKNDIAITHHPRTTTRKTCLFSKTTCRISPHDYALHPSLASRLARRHAKPIAHASSHPILFGPMMTRGMMTRGTMTRGTMTWCHVARWHVASACGLILAPRRRTTFLSFRSRRAFQTRGRARTTLVPPPQTHPAPTQRWWRMMRDGGRAMMMATIMKKDE